MASVYRYYDASGILLYVGITSTATLRNRQHNRDKAWWPFVSEQAVDHFDTKDEAHGREVELIQTFRPPFNIQHNPDYRTIRRAYIQLQESGQLGRTARQIIAAKGGKKTLQLVLSSRANYFFVHPEDAPLVHHFVHPNDVPVFQQGRRIGNVKEVHRDKGSVRIGVHYYGVLPGAISKAVAYLKYVSLKQPVKIAFRSIQIETADAA